MPTGLIFSDSYQWKDIWGAFTGFRKICRNAQHIVFKQSSAPVPQRVSECSGMGATREQRSIAGHGLSPASCPPHSTTDRYQKKKNPPQTKNKPTTNPPQSQFNYTPGKARPCCVHLRVKKRGSLNYLRDSKIWMTILSATYGSRGYFIQAKKTC